MIQKQRALKNEALAFTWVPVKLSGSARRGLAAVCSTGAGARDGEADADEVSADEVWRFCIAVTSSSVNEVSRVS